MKAPDFAYARPATLDEALRLLAEHGTEAVPLAGGQSLMPTLNMRLSSPALVVDIGGLDELRGIAVDGRHVRIGALTRHVEVLNSPVVRQHLPLVAEAVTHVGHVAIRNRGTFGGSLANGDPAAEMPACAVALGATLVLAGKAGRREVPAAAFYRGLFDTDRRPDELLVEARVPVQPAGAVSGFAELSRRHGDFAVVGLAATGSVANGALAALTLVFMGCVDRPRPAVQVAAALTGRPLPTIDDPAVAAAVAAELDPAPSPGWSAETKRHLAAVLAHRVARDLIARAPK
ncbi:MAG: xanthine dehydrogenase family protein subunit M [Rhodospirillales bacterium]